MATSTENTADQGSGMQQHGKTSSQTSFSGSEKSTTNTAVANTRYEDIHFIDSTKEGGIIRFLMKK
jgi:hypothetical protein